MSNFNMKDLANQMKQTFNEAKEGAKAKTYTSEDDLSQVKSWVPLKPFFKAATGGDGFPCGHITQLIGKPDSGKTTLLMEGLISTQKAGGVAFLNDAEHKFSLSRFALMGGKVEDLIILPSENLEEAWDNNFRACNLIKEYRSKGVPLEVPMMIAWDSIAASTPKAIMESDAGDSHMAVDAKINNKNVRRLRSVIKEANIALVGINHYYMTVPKNKYEQPKIVVKGGEELEFLSTLIIHTKKGAQVTREFQGETQRLGWESKYTVHKGHSHGRTFAKTVYVVDIGILENDEQLIDYKKTLRGAI